MLSVLYRIVVFWGAMSLLSSAAAGQNIESKEFNLEPSEQDQFLDISKNLRCPTCSGLSILESEAAFSVQIRDIVKEKVKAGEGKSEILDYFEERYGPWILRSPPTKGYNLLAWAIPVSMLVLGPILVWVLIWRKKKTIDTLGVRSAREIIEEFEEKLSALRAKMLRAKG